MSIFDSFKLEGYLSNGAVFKGRGSILILGTSTLLENGLLCIPLLISVGTVCAPGFLLGKYL